MLQADMAVTESADISAIKLAGQNALTINDQGALLNGADAYRGLFAHSGATTIEDLKIEHAVAHGGAGGAGLGGDHPGFAEMLERLLSNGARTIIVESPDRFARDLMARLAGHDMLKARGVTLVAASALTHFVEDTPTAILVRQVLGAIAEFEKTTLVAKPGRRGSASARRRARREKREPFECLEVVKWRLRAKSSGREA